MIKPIIASLIIFFASCGYRMPWQEKHRPKPSATPMEAIVSKSEGYMQRIPVDKDGWIMTDKCDALLFTGLYDAALTKANRTGADILAARDSDGKWHRRPSMDCGPSYGTSRSIVSRDMFIGLMFSLLFRQDKQTARELLDYAKENAYLMGSVPDEGTPGELFLTPVYMRTLSDLVAKLEGKECDWAECYFPVTFSGGAEGFQRHLQVWHILLRGHINNYIIDSELAILKKHAEEQPKNPLYTAAYSKYTDGNFSDSIQLLLDSKLYPIDHQPTSANFCSDWPIQRDYGKDWQPCPAENHQHTGAGLVVIYELVIRS